MYKIIKVGDKVSVFFDNGSTLERTLTKEEIIKVMSAETEDEIMRLMVPDYDNKALEYDRAVNTLNNMKSSKILSVDNDSIYWKDVSPLSVPVEFAESVLKAEFNNDTVKLEAYKNFWTLMSLNPNEECRKNLFWFLTKYDMTIAKCGFFVGYRNVDTTNEKGVYTDHHSHSFKIKIGEMVTMPREKCDCDSSVSCSRGLHCSSVGWLKRNYFGNTGLACLINPADVVAVPHIDNYGKLRTCAYLPIEVINYDENEDVIPLDVEDGFDCSYVTKVIYEGIMGTEADSPYRIIIPELPKVQKKSIQNTLLDIAKDCIVNKQL